MLPAHWVVEAGTMPAGLGSETDAFWSLRRKGGVLVGTGNLETWQRTPKPGRIWLMGVLSGSAFREPR